MKKTKTKAKAATTAKPKARSKPVAADGLPVPEGPRTLDKRLFEAGQQCHKRLWLDYHEPAAETPSASRAEMSRVGAELRELARSAFPKGVAVEGENVAAAAAATSKLLAESTPVLFGATFVADGVEARCDILVVHGNRSVDLFEVKSGTKVKLRYISDLALQATVIEKCGLQLRAAFLLHLNPQYAHKEGAAYPPMQLLRSADVTARVQKQRPLVQRRLEAFRKVLGDRSVLELPTGTFCTSPFQCPHLARCAAEGPAQPLRELPELTRQLELELHQEGIEELTALDPQRAGLTFRQRRTLLALRENRTIIEPFIASELRDCVPPLHFLALATLAESLPRFEQQRPWRRVPYGWAARTIHADGRLEAAAFVHVERADPRLEFVSTLAKHLEVGGTILCWDDESLNEMSQLLDDLPAGKAAVRAILGRPHLDMMQLFDAGVFHPALRSHRDLRASVQLLLGDDSGGECSVADEDSLLAALLKAQAPRVRSAMRDKIAAEIKSSLEWHAERLLALFQRFAQVEPRPSRPPAIARPKATKQLPPLPGE